MCKLHFYQKLKVLICSVHYFRKFKSEDWPNCQYYDSMNWKSLSFSIMQRKHIVIEKSCFPNFELPSSGCGLSVYAAYMAVCTVLLNQFTTPSVSWELTLQSAFVPSAFAGPGGWWRNASESSDQKTTEERRGTVNNTLYVLWSWHQQIKSLTVFNLGSELKDLTVSVLHWSSGVEYKIARLQPSSPFDFLTEN